jgi:hypothetical protein
LVCEKTPYGCWIFGWGTAKSETLALEKAFREYLMNLWAHRLHNGCTSQLLLKNPNDQPTRNILFAQNHASTANEANSSLIESIFYAPPSDRMPTNFDKYKAQFLSLNPDDAEYTLLPTFSDRLHSVKATHRLLITPEFGINHSDHFLNSINRISAYFRESDSNHRQHSQPEHLLHPLD